MNQNSNQQNVNISQETIQRILGEKEMVILVLRSKIEELERELSELKGRMKDEIIEAPAHIQRTN